MKKDSELEKYIEMFDGNIMFIKDFVDSNKNLEGIFIVFFMLILNLDWIDLKKKSIKSELTNLGAMCKPKNIPKILKSIHECKNKEEGWSNFEDIKEGDELYPILGILEKKDLIIQRRLTQFKLKNGLTEQILNDYQF